MKEQIKELPKLPMTTPWGAYDPVTLYNYLKETKEAKMSTVDIANHLKVPLQRVLYFQHREVSGLLERKTEQILNG